MLESKLDIKRDIKVLQKRYEELVNLAKEWNIHDFNSCHETICSSFSKIKDHLEELENNVKQKEELFISPEYAAIIERLFGEHNIGFLGRFPVYEIFPYRLIFNIKKKQAKIVGDKIREKNYNLNPESIVRWVSEKYNAIWSRRFDEDEICQELLTAYQYIVGFNSDQKVRWGRNILIREIYNLWTIKSIAKEKYTESMFLVDLSKLLRKNSIEYKDYIFIFSSHRDSKNNYRFQSPNNTRSFGILAIHKKSEYRA
ncbi:hypothetical protein MZ909_03170 [Thermosynechococcus sp. B0]|uniref:hypothetical protein n=1 Tax=unclassified Thermosynechococcus TaxID=2622553 RepID=UPI00122DD101|nr:MULTISPECIES: hypothetical protein [unclassified Thermosynechococcus]MDR7993691.1 hypothetical protein [Thermosynechococcus sp. TG252]QEQ00470.1 hypothetical protein FFX45_03125 [Thermosynechococcus sp. CL-1]WJI24697.1 hypothetical protein MZ909_03170 [Thermosynechococcus sp. B0]WJI29745.1 hypothetical protein M0646_03205 [Thermosynechococcus sp. B3]WKT84330.1 hypothetical protein QYC28_03130 [Thermosynechococcus sp. HY596]